MSTTEVVDDDALAPAPESRPSPEREGVSDELARLEERRRDAYRVG